MSNHACNTSTQIPDSTIKLGIVRAISSTIATPLLLRLIPCTKTARTLRAAHRVPMRLQNIIETKRCVYELISKQEFLRLLLFFFLFLLFVISRHSSNSESSARAGAASRRLVFNDNSGRVVAVSVAGRLPAPSSHCFFLTRLFKTVF